MYHVRIFISRMYNSSTRRSSCVCVYVFLCDIDFRFVYLILNWIWIKYDYVCSSHVRAVNPLLSFLFTHDTIANASCSIILIIFFLLPISPMPMWEDSILYCFWIKCQIILHNYFPQFPPQKFPFKLRNKSMTLVRVMIILILLLCYFLLLTGQSYLFLKSYIGLL